MQILRIALISALSRDARSDRLYEGFPEAGHTLVHVGKEIYQITEFLGSGPKKRAYVARRTAKTPIAPDQLYMPPQETGILLDDIALPDEVVIKCSATDQRARKDKLISEFEALRFLNRLRSVRKPIGLYLSKQWKCFGEGEFVCQYLVMTKASDDLRKIIVKNSMGLRAPLVHDNLPADELMVGFSFELFLATFSLSLIGELEKLHAVGLVHRDMSIKNVALDQEDPRLVTLIDMGSSSFLTKYDSIHKIEKVIKHDFHRVRRVSLQLLAEAVSRSYHQEEVNSSMAHLFPVINDTTTMTELRISLLQYLKREHPDVRFDGKIVYQ